MLEITLGCKSLFGTTDQEEIQEEVIIFCFSSLSLYLLESFKKLYSICKHIRKLISF